MSVPHTISSVRFVIGGLSAKSVSSLSCLFLSLCGDAHITIPRNIQGNLLKTPERGRNVDTYARNCDISPRNSGRRM
jgi:hypothetical protein